MPVAVIEAMAVGVPVVASRCAGNVDVIRDSGTGYLFDSAEQAAELIELCLSRSMDVEEVKESARLDTLSRFSIDRFEADLSRLYENGSPQVSAA
jgi:glycosyltransferase involved in cell wall biosynthesis